MHTITIIGLGAGELAQLPLGIYRRLQQAQRVVARTNLHPVLDELKEEGFVVESFDDVYEQQDQFEQVYDTIVEKLLVIAQQEPITYVVPGHPLVAERTVQLLIEEEQAGRITLDIVGGGSFLDPLFTALRVDPIEGFQLLDGTALVRDDVNMNQHVLIAQVYDAFVASEVKLTLLEKYAYDYPVTIVTAAGSSAEKRLTVPLYELDRVTEIDNVTTVYVPPVQQQEDRLKEWTTFRDIIATLRGPNGCPWDREQTHTSLKKYVIEETYELLEAIDQEDDNGIIEELGDVLLQVFLHAQIGEDAGYFSMEDVLESISAKMIRRHPHVFGNVDVQGTDEVLANWQEIKAQENQHRSSVLDGQERHMSSLLTAYNYQKEAAKVGFDWPTIEGAFEKCNEEWAEFQKEVIDGTPDSRVDELGDVFFTLVNIARFLKISPEEAMQHANRKFKHRFTYVEQCVRNGEKEFQQYSLDELENFWQQAKGRDK